MAFNVGCLVLVMVMLSTRHYTFTWETTILSDQTYRKLTGALSVLPGAVGFPTPTETQIADAQWPVDPEVAEKARGAWSGLLIGSLVVYGLVPRLVLLGLCLARAAKTRSRWRLDTSRPGYLRLREAVMPRTARLGVVDAAGTMPDAREPAVPTAPSGGPRSGPTALVGLEIELPASPWPPRIEGARWDDHGLVDTGDDRRRVLEELSASQPARVVVVCSLTTTPDRGHRSFLDELTRAAGAPVCVVLTGGEALRRRRDGGQVGARVEDWRHLARSAGIGSDRVLEVDLDHLTDVTESELSKLVGTATVGPAAVRRIEPAFDLVVEHLDRWPAVPEPKAQAELHRQIASLYRQEQESWRAFLGAPAELGGDVTAALRAGADRVVQLLPARLRMRPAWVASGAVAGALGCVAAATLLAPVAITALPVWSALGAVVGAVTGASTARDDDRGMLFAA